MKKKILSLTILLLTYSLGITTTDNSGTASFSFLKLYSGLKAQAMGENFVAVDEGISTIYYNPAGIVGNKNFVLLAEHMLWIDIMSKSNLSFVLPSLLKLGSFGFGLDYINIPYEKREFESDNDYESSAVNISVLHISYAQKIKEKILLGLTLKFIMQSFGMEEQKHNENFGFALDVGGIYKISNKTNLGVVIKNIGTEYANTESKDKLATILKLGQATKFLDEKLLLVSDLEYGFVDMTASLGIGCEYKLTKVFYPRIGYKYRITNNNLGALYGVNLGFGVNYKKINFDYAFTPKDDLGTVHQVSLGYNF